MAVLRQCRFCEAQFNRSEHFKRHERSHTGEKPFTCVICGMSFVRNDLMLRHGRLKHKTNLGKPQKPIVMAIPEEGLHTLASVLPDPVDSTTMGIEAYFTSLDPSFYGSWATSKVSPLLEPTFSDLLPSLTIPDTNQLLAESGFRDVLVKTVQGMSQPPKIPSSSSLNRYVALFIEKFHPHSPFLPPTFDIDSGNPLLLISMASIGALYGMERKTALMLHIAGKNLEENLRSILGCEEYPLWGVQSLYLLTTFAAWSGFEKGVQYTISHMPILAMLSRGLYRKLLSASSILRKDEWFEQEAMRRTYFCIYLFSGMVTLVFAAAPVFTTIDSRGLLLPCTTDEWIATADEMTWTQPDTPLYDDAMKALWSGNPLLCSAFGVRILVTSLFLEIWQAQHGHTAWLQEDWKERHFTVLECLQNHINHAWNSFKADPLIGNATFILRGCYVYLATNTTFVEDAIVHSNGPALFQGIKLAYKHFDASYVDLRSVRIALGAFADIVRRGLQFVGNTGCWSRGIEHALCGFYANTLLVHWVRNCEENKTATPEEADLMGELQKALEEGDVHIHPHSLSATLARSSIQLMDQVWVWGITPLMGEAFRLYADEILGSGVAIMDVEPVRLEDQQSSE